VFWDDLVRRWRRDARVVSPRLLRATGGHVAVLPAPRRGRRNPLLLVIVTLALVGAAYLLAMNRISILDNDVQPTPASTASVGAGPADV
jgi:hypothetical protein